MANRNGARPKPAADKALRGNPGNRKSNVVPIGTTLQKTDPPKHLPAAVKKVWTRFAPDLVKAKILTETSLAMFEMFCREYAHYLRYSDYITGETLFVEGDGGRRYRNAAWQEYREIQKAAFGLGVEFGLTPVALHRAGAQAPEGKKTEWDDY